MTVKMIRPPKNIQAVLITAMKKRIGFGDTILDGFVDKCAEAAQEVFNKSFKWEVDPGSGHVHIKLVHYPYRKWKSRVYIRQTNYTCSACGFSSIHATWKFCPSCGKHIIWDDHDS